MRYVEGLETMALEKYKLIGKRIRQAREERGMNQAELAEAIGFSAPSVTYFETGKRRISIEDLEKVAEVLHKPITYFISREPLDERTQAELQKASTIEEIKDMPKKIEDEEKQIEKKVEECAEKEFDIIKHPGYIPLDTFKLIPIRGRIHAGELHAAIQHAEEMLPIPANAGLKVMNLPGEIENGITFSILTTLNMYGTYGA